MTRVRTVRALTCHANLTCGHNLHIGVHGFYPVAALCPACPPQSASWITSQAILTDDRALVSKTDPLPEPWTVTVDQPPAVQPPAWQTYTIAIHTARRHNDYDSPDEYVLNAPSVTDAMVLAARAATAGEQCGIEALIAIDDDGLPTIHVVCARTGMPTHPADTPGLAWTDLRTDTPTPQSATSHDPALDTASSGSRRAHTCTTGGLSGPAFPDHAEQVQRALSGLADAITRIQGRQDQRDKQALDLVRLAGLDVQDIIDTIGGGRIDVVEELTKISTWLAGNVNGQSRLVGELTRAIAAAINELTAS
ncbi:hypothetical protein AB0H43_13735 [Hamadaea sp. NPDC050747]|uniref:hypothetical protein n=1 Tax=Hamadaea sp. NPDC050747 TaxID=3155789 RepID=UPI0033EFE7D5